MSGSAQGSASKPEPSYYATAQHDAIKQLMGKLVFAPVDLSSTRLRVLDSGTGDGQWLYDLHKSLPSRTHNGDEQVQLIGTDLSDAKFPHEESVQSSISFRLQNITQKWPDTFTSSFDLVHQRLVLGACGSYPFVQVIKELTQLVKPGGWIQLIEPDQVIGFNDGPAMKEFITLIEDVFVGMGGHIRYAANVAQWLKEAGMVHVEDRSLPLQLGAKIADKNLSERTAYSTAAAVIPLTLYIQKFKASTSLQESQLNTLEDRLIKELLQQGAFYPLRIIWAQRPL